MVKATNIIIKETGEVKKLELWDNRTKTEWSCLLLRNNIGSRELLMTAVVPYPMTQEEYDQWKYFLAEYQKASDRFDEFTGTLLEDEAELFDDTVTDKCDTDGDYPDAVNSTIENWKRVTT